MEKELWKQKFKQRIMSKSGLNSVQAEECLKACLGSDCLDFEDTPENQADEEMSNWD